MLHILTQFSKFHYEYKNSDVFDKNKIGENVGLRNLRCTEEAKKETILTRKNPFVSLVSFKRISGIFIILFMCFRLTKAAIVYSTLENSV